MKKICSLFLFVVFAAVCNAQTASFLLTAAPCHNDGVLEATFTGLTPPLTVTWQTYGTTGTFIIHTSVTGLTDDLTGYSGGEVSISAADGTGATATGYYSGNPPFTICAFTIGAAVCPALDTITASVCSGGTAPYTFQWYNIATTAIIGAGSTIYEMPGNYGVNVTDAAGCTFGSKVSGISALAYALYPAYTDSITTTLANCTNGTATITPYGGGTPPYSYSWSNGATSPTILGLVAGTYGVTVTDATGCQVTDNASISQSELITAPVVATPATCAAINGSIVVAPAGGTPPYTYAWNNGITTASQTGLMPGLYSVAITDAAGCIGSGSGYVGAAAPITVSTAATPSLCTAPTGNATLSITGGTGPYDITWYTTPAQTGITAHTLASGTYSFQVADAAGCTQDGTVNVPPIDVIGVSFSAIPALCSSATGSLTAYPSGGVAPYSYSWSTGATTAGITSRPAGPYSVTITDHVGCSSTTVQSLPDNSPLEVGITSSPASCVYSNDGSETATVWGGTPPYSYAWSSGGATAVISALTFGPYALNVTDAAGCTSNDNYSYVAYNPTDSSCFCTISGTVYDDYNVNCMQDPGEPGIPNMPVMISGMGYTYTDANGNYSMRVPSGSYTVTESVLGFYPLSGCQLNGIPVTVSASSGCVHTVNFANTADTVHDVHISTWDYNLPRPVPGQSYSQVVIVSNDGTVSEDSILVHYNPDGQLLAPYITPGGIFGGSPFQYSSNTSFPTLAPGSTQQLFTTYTVPENMPLGTNIAFMDTVSYKSPISQWQNDYTPWNNVNDFTTTTVSSANPNFKEVNPTGTGPTGIISYTDSVLEYMIHFQNTGSAVAENVVIVDTLDNNLNWTSFRPVFESSAQCYITLSQHGTKNIVIFTFRDINLPADASDAMGSNGMLTYTIKQNGGLPVGAQIMNHATIYFDYNTPVVTNTTLNTIGTAAPLATTKLSAQTLNSFTVYPNPASNSFYALISSNTSGSADLIISDVSGKSLITKKIGLQNGTQTISTDVSQLAPGVYFVSLNQSGATQTQKLVIMH